MSGFYCNEIDPYAAEWLRELMKAGQIPNGVVDERSIKELDSIDVDGPGERHFFAGIGGWPLALRIAGWPATRSVWTGSCPCQPYSQAGKRKGSEDERDLWPEFFRLIRECRPETIFGEQVASGDVVGTELEAAFVAAIQASNYARANRLAERIARVAAKRNESLDELVERWVDRICADLEAIGYAVWPIVFGAHSVLAPHKRQRLYWTAHAKRSGVRGSGLGTPRTETSGMQDEGNERERLRADAGPVRTAELGGVANPSIAERKRRAKPSGQYGGTLHAANGGSSHGLGDPNGTGREPGRSPTPPNRHGDSTHAASSAHRCGFWDRFEFVNCADGKARRIEPGILTVVDGVPFRLADGRTVEGVSRAATLKGIGNAIVPQVAAEFVRAFLEAEREVQ